MYFRGARVSDPCPTSRTPVGHKSYSPSNEYLLTSQTKLCSLPLNGIQSPYSKVLNTLGRGPFRCLKVDIKGTYKIVREESGNSSRTKSKLFANNLKRVREQFGKSSRTIWEKFANFFLRFLVLAFPALLIGKVNRCADRR